MKQFEVAFGIFADIIPNSLDSIIYLYYLVAIIRTITRLSISLRLERRKLNRTIQT